MESNLTNELLQAILAATDEQKKTALRVLKGDPVHSERQPTEPFLTLREVGRRLGISPCSLWRWGVPGHELGGRRRFRVTEVEAYLSSKAFTKRAEALRADRAERKA